MKKVSFIVLTVIMCFAFSMSDASAITLGQYIEKAEAALNAKKAAESKKKMTEEEKKKALAEKEQVEEDITNTEIEIARLEDEIKKLENSIKKKNKEIKKIMKFVQVSNGESAYLEYAFGASSFTDFIYRISVAEQLSDYNDKLIDSYNNDIKNLGKKQTELSEKKVQLTKKEAELKTLVQKLSAQIDELTDASQSSEQEYQNFMKYVKRMESKGCRKNEDLSACEARLAPPPVTGGSVTGGGNANGFYIPLTQGRVTQNWKGAHVHNAIDMANYENAPVYAITTGIVRTVTTGCGEKVVYIVHNVGGKKYTTVYYHLRTVTVHEDQVVNYTTQIGTQGGNPNHGATCGCTGSHVDVKLFTGEYLRDFYTLTGDGAKYNTDPRRWLTQLPPVGSRFSHR